VHGAHGMGTQAPQAAATPGWVSKVAVPPPARELATLARVDYEDAFLLQTAPGHDRTPEQWARFILEGPPVRLQRLLRVAWSVLGLQLGPSGSPGFVFGWELRRNTPDFALLHVRTRLGGSAELLFQPQEDALLWCTFAEAEGWFGRVFPVVVVPVHVRAVRDLLVRAGRRIREEQLGR
jgi:hypothetical protein